jgi:ribosomal protein S16
MKDLIIRLRKRKSTSQLFYDLVVMHKYKRPRADYFERVGL